MESYIVFAEIIGWTSYINAIEPEQIIVGFYDTLGEAIRASFANVDLYLMLLLDSNKDMKMSIKVKILEKKMKINSYIKIDNNASLEVVVYSVSIMKLSPIKLLKERTPMPTPDYIYEYLLNELNVVIGRIKCLDKSLERDDLLETVKDCRESVKRMREMNKKKQKE